MILAQTQYALKVKSPGNIMVWWIMTIDNLSSWFTIGSIECVSHILVYVSWETYPNGQDKSSLQLENNGL